jgi:allantoinase
VTPEKLHYRHAISPYMGERLRGVVHATYLRGQPVYRAGAFDSSPQGRELTLC